MPVFKSSFVVDAPLEAVRAFHQGDAEKAFAALAPPGTWVTIQTPMKKMEEGSLLGFTLWFGGVVPIQWLAKHSEVTAQGFVDTMMQGPMDSWVHKHRFLNDGPRKTLVEDTIVYEYGKPLRGFLAMLAFNSLSLQVLFAWRRFATRRALK